MAACASGEDGACWCSCSTSLRGDRSIMKPFKMRFNVPRHAATPRGWGAWRQGTNACCSACTAYPLPPLPAARSTSLFLGSLPAGHGHLYSKRMYCAHTFHAQHAIQSTIPVRYPFKAVPCALASSATPAPSLCRSLSTSDVAAGCVALRHQILEHR